MLAASATRGCTTTFVERERERERRKEKGCEEEEGREEMGSIYSRGTKSCDWPGFDIGAYVAS